MVKSMNEEEKTGMGISHNMMVFLMIADHLFYLGFLLLFYLGFVVVVVSLFWFYCILLWSVY